MELKCRAQDWAQEGRKRSNCTFMELKYDSLSDTQEKNTF